MDAILTKEEAIDRIENGEFQCHNCGEWHQTDFDNWNYDHQGNMYCSKCTDALIWRLRIVASNYETL